MKESTPDTSPIPTGDRTRVLILGGGFGGVTAARALDRNLRTWSNLQIVVVDRSNALYFTPLLWTVAEGRAEAGDVAVPLRSLVRSRRIALLHAEIRSIDLGARIAETSAGRLSYDFLVVALGSETAFPGIRGLRDFALTFRTPVDALQLRNRIIDAVEQAQHDVDPTSRSSWLTFVVAGGGDTGVELAATIRNYIDSALLGRYPALAHNDVRVILVERMKRLIPMGSERASGEVRRTLEQQGIEVRTAVSVESVTGDTVETSDGDIPSHTVFWAAGISAPDAVRTLPLEHAANGSVTVDESLRAIGHPEVFVIGDAAWAHDGVTGAPIPPTAQAAEHEGRFVARAIEATLRHDPVPPFHYRSRGHLTLLGRRTGVAEIGPFTVTGVPAWLIWHAYYLSHIPAWRNRVRLAFSWTISAIFGRATAQLPLGPVSRDTQNHADPLGPPD